MSQPIHRLKEHPLVTIFRKVSNSAYSILLYLILEFISFHALENKKIANGSLGYIQFNKLLVLMDTRCLSLVDYICGLLQI